MSKEPLDHIPPSAIGNPLSLFATNSGNITTFVCRLKIMLFGCYDRYHMGGKLIPTVSQNHASKVVQRFGIMKESSLGFLYILKFRNIIFFFYYWDWRCGFGLVLYGWLCVYTKNKIKLVNGMSLFRMLLIFTDMSIFRDCAYNKTSMY